MTNKIKSLAFGIALALVPIGMEASAVEIAMVKACGEAIAMGSQDQIQQNALESAKVKAVKKALARFIAPGGTNSIYGEMVRDYRKYVVGRIDIYNKTKGQNKFYLYCNVPVDFDAINKDMEKKIGALQNQESNENDQAMFLVRVTGAPAGIKVDGVRTLISYKNDFRNYGFNPVGEDGGENALVSMLKVQKNYETLPYEKFREKVIEDSKNNLTMTYVVLGEINITNVNSLSDSTTAEALCRLEVIKPQADNTLPVIQVASFNESYTVNGRNAQEAVIALLDKATTMSSKKLADATYSYWRNHNYVSQ